MSLFRTFVSSLDRNLAKRASVSSRFPEVNVPRPTTKVNLWMIAAIVMFLAVAAAVAFWTSRQAASPAGGPPGAAEKK